MQPKQTEKYQAIIKATLELMATQGFHATPTSQIATRAGVGVGTIYRYFKNKDELIHATHAQQHKRMRSVISGGEDMALPDRELFIQRTINLINHLLKHPEEFKFMEQYYNSPFGIEERRDLSLEKDCEDADLEKPFAQMLFRCRGKSIKDLPMPLITALVCGPMIFIIRDHFAGLIELTNERIKELAQGSWDAIKR